MLKLNDKYIKLVNEEEKKLSDIFNEIDINTFNNSKKVLDAFHKNNISEIHYFYFTTPFNVCWERNSKRQGREFVPKSSIRRMYLSMTDPINDSKINTPVVIHYVDEYGNEIKKI